MNNNFGKVYGIGVGPGDPELITLKALNILKRMPIIAWPAPLEGDSLARSIAASHIPKGCVEIPIRMALDLDHSEIEKAYDHAAQKISEHLKQGQNCAILCEGDPFFYGSFMYLYGRLYQQFSVEVIPGISSLMAAPARLGCALASRNDSLVVVPAPQRDDDIVQSLRHYDAIVIIKIGRHFERIKGLIAQEELTPYAHYISHATMEAEVQAPLADFEGEQAPYFSMILIHKRGVAWV